MNTLLIIQIFITLALIGVILLQRSEGGALGMGGGNSSSMFTARGSANLLTRITAVLAALFMGNCLVMTVITSHSINNQTKVASQTPSQQ
jgi:preprotein translocase subunit SecG